MGSETRDVVVCEQCGGEPVEAGYDLALCRSCREALAHRRLPGWIRAAALLVLLLFLLALSKLPTSLAAGTDLQKGIRAAAHGRNSEAAVRFQKVLKRFPESPEARARLALAYAQLGDAAAFVNTLRGLKRGDVPADVLSEIDASLAALREHLETSRREDVR